MNPYVFLVGCPRSGTTLLRRMADAHPQLAIVDQTRWITRTYEFRRGLTAEGLVTPKLLERMRDPRRLKKLDIDEGDLERLFGNGADVPFARFVTALFELCGERQGKRFVGDKSPGYVRYLPMLHELWPEAKFVHIIRDGRDVCLSVLDWRKGATSFSTFGDDPVTTTGVWWDWYVRLGREGGSQLGAGLYDELRYESLVAQPEGEIAQLCAFLALPYDDAMLRFHEGRRRRQPGLSAKAAWLPVTGGLRDWKATMRADDVLRFEAAAGDLLEELGYPRAAPSVPARMRDHAARIRTQFAGQLQARRRPLPRAWESAVDVEPAREAISAAAIRGES